MHKILYTFLATLSAFSNEAAQTEESEDIAKISEAMGHLIGKNLQALGLPLDIEALVRGMQEAAEGKDSPLSEEDCVQAIAALQEESIARTAEKNLEEADAFLEKNSQKPEMITLEQGKLQFEIVKPGQGQTVNSYNAPLIRYKGRYLNGPSIPVSEELIDLEEAIPGFSKGIIGMKEGESRILYIHPELGYGKQGNVHPNALLIFEVEVIKADASSEAHAASNRDQLPMQIEDDGITPLR